MCGNCQTRLKFEDKEWCERCIEVYRRAKSLSTRPKIVAKAIVELVGEEYMDATISHIDEKYWKPFLHSGVEDVFLWGDVGRGKTYLMAAMIREYILLGYTCERINFDDFCSKIRSTMNSNSTITEHSLVKELKDVDKLFIDDMGLRSRAETEFVFVTFFSILDNRQSRLLQTFISTNKTIAQLSTNFDRRIASRLSTAVNIHMTGEDRRKG